MVIELCQPFDAPPAKIGRWRTARPTAQTSLARENELNTSSAHGDATHNRKGSSESDTHA
eukprot:6183763-Pleurochrysis_carterae.AAC.2